MYELTIIGGGPAGVAAGVYASRKQLQTLFLTDEWGGQSTVSNDIQNWIGSPSISGMKLAEDLKVHLETYAQEYVSIRSGVRVTALKKVDEHFVITLNTAETFESKTVLIASGSKRRKLPAKNADLYEHKGLTYCASCDGPMFSGQDVAVIGGGNAGFESAAQLLAYAKSVTLFQQGDAFKADPVTVQKVLSHQNMKGILNANVTEIHGDKFVSGLTYEDLSGTHEIYVAGVFVEIGMIPNTEYLGDLVPLDTYQRIKIDPWTHKTETAGIWAAGDCTNVLYHQNNIAAGDGVRALEDIYVTLRTK